MRCMLLAMVAAFSLNAGSAMAAGDAEAGKVKGYTCTGCHGIPGYNNVYPTYNVPKIAGQNAEYIQAALSAYRNGDRQHETMNAHASSLSDSDIADIAAWLSTAGAEE